MLMTYPNNFKGLTLMCLIQKIDEKNDVNYKQSKACHIFWYEGVPDRLQEESCEEIFHYK